MSTYLYWRVDECSTSVAVCPHRYPEPWLPLWHFLRLHWSRTELSTYWHGPAYYRPYWAHLYPFRSFRCFLDSVFKGIDCYPGIASSTHQMTCYAARLLVHSFWHSLGSSNSAFAIEKYSSVAKRCCWRCHQGLRHRTSHHEKFLDHFCKSDFECHSYRYWCTVVANWDESFRWSPGSWVHSWGRHWDHHLIQVACRRSLVSAQWALPTNLSWIRGCCASCSFVIGEWLSCFEPVKRIESFTDR